MGCGTTNRFVSSYNESVESVTADRMTDHKLAETLIDEFPCRPHWTKNTREVFERSAKNLDPDVRLFTDG